MFDARVWTLSGLEVSFRHALVDTIFSTFFCLAGRTDILIFLSKLTKLYFFPKENFLELLQYYH